MATNALKLKRPLPLPKPALTLPRSASGFFTGTRFRARKLFRKWLFTVSIALAIYYPRAKSNVGRIVVAIVIFDTMLASFILINALLPAGRHVHTIMAAAMEPLVPTRDIVVPAHENILPEDIGSIQENLHAIGILTIVAGSIEKPGMSVPGVVLSTGSDTLSVFTYAHNGRAHAEAALLAKTYAEATKRNIWAAQAHVYLKDATVIFYLGSDKELMETLSKNYTSLDTPMV